MGPQAPAVASSSRETGSRSAGSVRLSGTSYAVLGLVSLLQPCTPYDLKGFIEQSIANFWPVPHTTFYAEPARLASAGFLALRQESGGRRRKLYSLTDAGATALSAWVAEPGAAAPELRDELMLKVFLGADPQPLIVQRLDWHRRKLAELEGYLQEVRTEEEWTLHAAQARGVERSLVAGTAYQRAMLKLMGSLAAATDADT